MAQYRISELNIEIETKSTTLVNNLKPYETSFDYKPNLSLSISDDLLLQYMEEYEGYTADVIEDFYISTEFCRALFDFNGFPISATAVKHDDVSVLFSAPFEESDVSSKLPEEKVFCVNYPAVRLIRDVFYAYDTPFGLDGDKSKHAKLPIKSIVFVDKKRFDSLKRLDTKDMVSMFMRAVAVNIKDERTKHTLFMLEKVMRVVDIYGVGDLSDVEFILDRVTE
ncbi:MAG: hypothetical protein IKB73_03185 [Ruminococcus sp.]|nr:hypothetical protein [Ruminococcus sp.]